MNYYSVLSCRKDVADSLGFKNYETKQGYVCSGDDIENSAKLIAEYLLKKESEYCA